MYNDYYDYSGEYCACSVHRYHGRLWRCYETKPKEFMCMCKAPTSKNPVSVIKCNFVSDYLKNLYTQFSGLDHLPPPHSKNKPVRLPVESKSHRLFLHVSNHDS